MALLRVSSPPPGRDMQVEHPAATLPQTPVGGERHYNGRPRSSPRRRANAGRQLQPPQAQAQPHQRLQQPQPQLQPLLQPQQQQRQEQPQQPLQQQRPQQQLQQQEQQHPTGEQPQPPLNRSLDSAFAELQVAPPRGADSGTQPATRTATGTGEVPPPPEPDQPTARRRRRGPAPGERCYCPVASCPSADPNTSPGWQSVQSMRAHVEAHRTGQYQGSVPQTWLVSQGLTACEVCDRLLVGVPGAVHPRCRPAARATATVPDTPPPDTGLPPTTGAGRLPSLAAVTSDPRSTLRYVPASCKFLWSKALTRVLAAAVYYNVAPGTVASPEATQRSLAAWTELLMLAKCVLAPPPRSAKNTATTLKTTHAVGLSAGWTGNVLASGPTLDNGGPQLTKLPPANTPSQRLSV